jgi:hypothetical protein
MERETPRPTFRRSGPDPSIEELAAEQGVKPVNFDDLLGHPSPEDETVEEFEAMLREWRGEGTKSGRP